MICSNAKTYNSPDTIYYRQADKLLDIGKRLIEREYPNIAEEDPASSTSVSSNAAGKRRISKQHQQQQQQREQQQANQHQTGISAMVNILLNFTFTFLIYI